MGARSTCFNEFLTFLATFNSDFPQNLIKTWQEIAVRWENPSLFRSYSFPLQMHNIQKELTSFPGIPGSPEEPGLPASPSGP